MVKEEDAFENIGKMENGIIYFEQCECTENGVSFKSRANFDNKVFPCYIPYLEELEVRDGDGDKIITVDLSTDNEFAKKGIRLDDIVNLKEVALGYEDFLKEAGGNEEVADGVFQMMAVSWNYPDGYFEELCTSTSEEPATVVSCNCGYTYFSKEDENKVPLQEQKCPKCGHITELY